MHDTLYEQFKPSIQAYSTILNKIKIAIENNDFDTTKKYFHKYPELINAPLNSRNQTALILAARSHRISIIKFLLSLGANYHMLDCHSLNALNYATTLPYDTAFLLILEHQNKLESIWAKIDDLITLLKDKIAQSDQASLSNKLLIQVLDQLEKRNDEKWRKDLLTDLYFTATALIIIACETDIENHLLKFFKFRENLLQGDSLDYCHTPSLANQLCAAVVKIVYPDIPSVYNILLQQTITKDRIEPWKDPYQLTYDLPSSAKDFIRTEHGRIMLYQAILERAINALKNGTFKLEEIWFSTDLADPNYKPLSRKELFLLKKRSPTFYSLVEFSTHQNKALIDNQNIYERLVNLRSGLLMGDAHHQGSETNAGEPANIAIAEFADWWNNLSLTKRGSTLRNQVEALNDINEVLTIILEPRTTVNRQSVTYCISLKGSMLDAAIQKHADLLKSFGNTNIRKSNEELDKIKNSIYDELEDPIYSIQTENNIFSKLAELDLPALPKHNTPQLSSYIMQYLNLFAKKLDKQNEHELNLSINLIKSIVDYSLYSLTQDDLLTIFQVLTLSILPDNIKDTIDSLFCKIICSRKELLKDYIQNLNPAFPDLEKINLIHKITIRYGKYFSDNLLLTTCLTLINVHAFFPLTTILENNPIFFSNKGMIAPILKALKKHKFSALSRQDKGPEKVIQELGRHLAIDICKCLNAYHPISEKTSKKSDKTYTNINTFFKQTKEKIVDNTHLLIHRIFPKKHHL